MQLNGGRLANGGCAVGAKALAQVQRLRADVHLPGPCAVDGDTGMWSMLVITAVSTLGFAGILAGPALIGFAANHFGLIAASIAVATALLLVAVSTRWLRV
ncbi:hypothetical protein QMZ26_04475 [Stenotrophomonas sp. PFBMAA-4]|nr:hypothetical protein [Stenotrophomonas sp. PFBMAA-4]MDI9272292.1 hypothetical protein [Stenotrophomonas sp. PFBMAA-4]